MSKSEVSRICAGLDEIVGAFRTRTLGHVGFPYVFLDATYLHVREAARGQVVSKAVVVATGVTEHGAREILGLDVGDSEDETFWRKFLTDLKDRGLSGVLLVISDQHAGLVKALTRCFAGRGTPTLPGPLRPQPARAGPQGTQGHGRRRCSARSSPSPTPRRCTRPGTKSATSSPQRSRRSARCMDDAKAEVLAFTAFPKAHWSKIWSNNPSSGSTRRSNAAPASWASSPTTPPSSA